MYGCMVGSVHVLSKSCMHAMVVSVVHAECISGKDFYSTYGRAGMPGRKFLMAAVIMLCMLTFGFWIPYPSTLLLLQTKPSKHVSHHLSLFSSFPRFGYGPKPQLSQSHNSQRITFQFLHPHSNPSLHNRLAKSNLPPPPPLSSSHHNTTSPHPLPHAYTSIPNM